MIYIVQNDKFIVGIFNSYKRAKCLNERLDRMFGIIQHDYNFPFFLLESTYKNVNNFMPVRDSIDFEFWDNLGKNHNLIKNIHTVYFIDKEWESSELGKDEMGKLDHEHFE